MKRNDLYKSRKMILPVAIVVLTLYISYLGFTTYRVGALAKIITKEVKIIKDRNEIRTRVRKNRLK